MSNIFNVKVSWIKNDFLRRVAIVVSYPIVLILFHVFEILVTIALRAPLALLLLLIKHVVAVVESSVNFHETAKKSIGKPLTITLKPDIILSS